MKRVAVAGNPNSGKTTLWNSITGSRAKVGNYPGVTVERKEATRKLPSGAPATFIDLPGCYSLTARSPEEEVAHRVLIGQLGGPAPDVVMCVVDATNLGRGLYLALQLRELGHPVVVALNMIDVAKAQGIQIDTVKLAERLGTPVVPTSARFGDGLPELLDAVDKIGDAQPLALYPELAEDDRASVTRVAAAAGSLGGALWLLTSTQEEVKKAASGGLLALVERERAGARPEQSRRVIAARYAHLDKLLVGLVVRGPREVDATTEKLDRLLMHPLWGLAIFFATMFVLFQAVFTWAVPMIDGIEALMGWLGEQAGLLIPLGLTRSLVTNGVIAGVGNVLVFLPQIFLLFLGLTLLEESGYLARAAFLLDRVMRRVGLHGKAFIPLMSGFACAVPAIMAARTVESSRDRLVTILVTPFMSCSARLPIYVLVIAAVFAGTAPVMGFLSIGGLVMAAMYALGFVAALGTAFVLKRSVLRSPAPAFLLEMPPYRLPVPRDVARRVFERCKVFVTTTGAIILALSMLLWALLTFPQQGLPEGEYATKVAAAQALAPEPQAAALEHLAREDRALRLENSFGGRIGHLIEPIIEPLGFDWRIGIGLVASFAAREVLVSTLGQVYALDADVEADSPSLREALLADRDPATGKPRFTPLVGVSLMVFFVLAMQCLSTVATVKRETNSWRWPIGQLVYMNLLAYGASLLVFQTGRYLGWGT